MDFAEESLKVLRANRRTTDGYQYTLPSTGIYPYQWLWDSCFHAIVLAKLEPEVAKNELRALLSKQFPDGMIPHMIFWQPSITRPYAVGWGKKGTSSITQPPMLAYAAWEIYKHTKDTAYLEEIFPGLVAFYRYLVDKRDPRDHHLASIINPDESGEDNSPRFDKAMNLRPDISFFGHFLERRKLMKLNLTCNFDAEQCMNKHFWVKDVPFNTILVKNLDILGHIASLLGHDESEHFAVLHSRLIKEAMREQLFEDGVYWSATGTDRELLKVATWAHFAPLFADLYTREEADALIKTHFHNPDTFHSPNGIRTTSKAEPAYRPAGFWRGPVWFAPQWFIYKGLRAYGYDAEADWIRDTSKALVEEHGFREYFNPETGAPHGAHGFTWGTLVLDMMDS